MCVGGWGWEVIMGQDKDSLVSKEKKKTKQTKTQEKASVAKAIIYHLPPAD